jgi:hypothetical protein
MLVPSACAAAPIRPSAWIIGHRRCGIIAWLPYLFLMQMGYGGDIMADALIPSLPLDQIVTVLDRILTRSGMRP